MILPDKFNEENNYSELQPTDAEWDLQIPNRNEIKNTVNSFVILVKVLKDNMPYFFAITGGLGFKAINKNSLENNFGLKVALNSIDTKELKFFDVRNIDLKTRQKRVLFNKGSEIGEFDLDFEQDLINLVSGKSRDQEFGTSVRSSTFSLSFIRLNE